MTQLGTPLHHAARPTAPEIDMLRLTQNTPMRKLQALKVVLCALLLAAGCVYQAPLSQGNLLDQEDIDQVNIGMTRGQVRFLLGTPMVDDPFHANRWDYVYFLRIGRDKAIFKRWISVLFDGDKVTEIILDQDLRPDL